MAWLRDPAWQQGVAILLVIAGASLIYRGAAVTEPGKIVILGVTLFSVGIALPLISQAFGARRKDTGRSEDV